MKKIVLCVMVLLGLAVVLSNVWITQFLFLDAKGIILEAAIEGSIISNGLAIVSLAVTVWLGISIYNIIEKKEIQELKMSVEKYSPLSQQMSEYIKQQLINQMYKTADVSSDYIAKRFDMDQEIPLERYADILTIDILLEKIYEAGDRVSKEQRLEWTRIGIDKINKYKGKFKKRYQLEMCYLDYREGDFYFFQGKVAEGKEKYEAYKRAKDLFLKAVNGFGISLVEEGFDMLPEREQRISVYFANAIGHCCSNMLKGIQNIDVRAEIKEEAYRYIVFATKMSKRCGEREVYYRNYGCLIENTTSDIMGLERAYEQYRSGLVVSSKDEDTYYVLISNLNKRIRAMLGIEMREPQKDRMLPLTRMQFQNVSNKSKVRKLINEMKNYIDIAVCQFPNRPSWYAFSVYRKIYEVCEKNAFDSFEFQEYLSAMKQDVMKIDMLEGKNSLCVVAKREVEDLNIYSRKNRQLGGRMLKQKLSGYPSIDKPWLKYYSEEVLNAPVPEKTIYQYMYDGNKDFPNDIAINYLGKEITYGEMFEKIDICAKAFMMLGVKEKDIVTVALPSIPEAIYIVYALNRIGAIANMIHPLAGKVEITNYLTEVSSTLFVGFDKTIEIMDSSFEGTKVETVLIVSPVESLRLIKRIGYKLVSKSKQTKGFLTWKQFEKMGKECDEKVSCVKNCADMAIISHTGGTTGDPKGVCLSDNNINAVLHQIGITLLHERQEKTLVVLPPFINYSLVNGILEALAFGFQTILIPQYIPEKIGEYLLKYKPNHINSIPPYLSTMLDCKEIQGKSLAFVKHLVSGGEGLEIEKEAEINKFLMEHGAELRLAKGLGCTELVSCATFAYEECNELGSVGIPLPQIQCKIVNPDTFQEMEYLEEGEICFSGPTLMLGYYGKKEATEEIMRAHNDGLTWLHMGDMGYMTEDGILFVTGRLKRIMITKGTDGIATKLYPERIEKVVEKIPEVSACCVVGIADDVRVNIPKVYVEINTEVEEVVLEKRIRELCKQELPDYMLPEEIEFIDEIPRTARGKVDYRKLEEVVK